MIRECQNNLSNDFTFAFFEGKYFSNVISVGQYSLDCRTYRGTVPCQVDYLTLTRSHGDKAFTATKLLMN